jgi:hypothetical protein
MCSSPSLTPAGQWRTIEGRLVAEHYLATEVLEERVLHPSVAQHLVGEIVHVFENEQPATSLVGSGGCPGPTRHAELKRLARKSQSIVPATALGDDEDR